MTQLPAYDFQSMHIPATPLKSQSWWLARFLSPIASACSTRTIEVTITSSGGNDVSPRAHDSGELSVVHARGESQSSELNAKQYVKTASGASQEDEVPCSTARRTGSSSATNTTDEEAQGLMALADAAYHPCFLSGAATVVPGLANTTSASCAVDASMREGAASAAFMQLGSVHDPCTRSCPTGPTQTTHVDDLTVLVAKTLTKSDATTRRIILPRISVETNMPQVAAWGYWALQVTDVRGRRWDFVMRAWSNGTNLKPVYVLEHISDFMREYNVREGDTMGLVRCGDIYMVELNTERLRVALHFSPAAQTGATRSSTTAQDAAALPDGALQVTSLRRPCMRTPGCTKPGGHAGWCVGHRGFKRKAPPAGSSESQATGATTATASHVPAASMTRMRPPKRAATDPVMPPPLPPGVMRDWRTDAPPGANEELPAAEAAHTTSVPVPPATVQLHQQQSLMPSPPALATATCALPHFVYVPTAPVLEDGTNGPVGYNALYLDSNAAALTAATARSAPHGISWLEHGLGMGILAHLPMTIPTESPVPV